MRKRSMVALGLLLMVAAGCGSSSIQPAPLWTGNYSGSYQVTSCSDGLLAGFCAGAGFNVGAQLPITMSLSQNGTSVGGNVTLGNLTGLFQGTVSGNMLSALSSYDLTSLTWSGVEVPPSITKWQSSLSGNNVNGTFTVTFYNGYDDSIDDAARITATVVTLTR
jgi:hypothetical protein